MGINKKTFTELLKSGRVNHSSFLSIRFLQPKLIEKPALNQYSFVVSAKVSKLATVRNLLKRRGRAIISKHKDEIIKPLICAFFFKVGSIGLSFVELEKEILSVLMNNKIIKQ